MTSRNEAGQMRIYPSCRLGTSARRWKGDSVVLFEPAEAGMLGWSGRDQGQPFYSFNLEEVVPTIISCAPLPTFLICRGFGRNWRRTILRLVDHRLIGC